MKTKHLLFSIGLFVTLLSFGQSGLNNTSFENWSNSTWGYSPTGWIGINAAQQTGGAHAGNRYVRLTNTTFNQGFLMLGTASTATVLKGGAPLNQMPAALNGFVKTSGLASGDVVGVQIYTSDNGTINALASYTVDTNLPAWTSFSLPLTIFGTSTNIDTVYIIATSGKIGPSSASNSVSATLDVDDFWLSGINAAGIDHSSMGTAFMVYPNPASDVFHIVSKDDNATRLKIADMSGRLAKEVLLEAEYNEIDLVGFANGFYIYTICDAENRALLSGKIAVTH